MHTVRIHRVSSGCRTASAEVPRLWPRRPNWKRRRWLSAPRGGDSATAALQSKRSARYGAPVPDDRDHRRDGRAGSGRGANAYALRTSLSITDEPLLVIAPDDSGKVQYEWIMPRLASDE